MKENKEEILKQFLLFIEQNCVLLATLSGIKDLDFEPTLDFLENQKELFLIKHNEI